MLKLIRAIGRVLGITKVVTLVQPVTVCQTGGDNNIAVQQHQRATPELKAKRSNVKVDTQGQSTKTETLPVRTHTKRSQEAGTRLAALVPQLAQSKRSSKSSVAKQDTKAALLSKKVQAVQAEHGEHGKQSVTPAKQSLQESKRKRLVVPSIKVVKSSKQEPTTTKPKATAVGKQAKTPVSKTPHHAKQAAKRKP